MAVKPTITAYGGGVEQFPIFLNRAFTDYSYERAERDFAKFISQTAKTSPTGSFNLQGANGQIIPEVVNARKMPNVNALGQDNLTDLSLVLRNGRTLRVNTKGSFAPIITHNNIFSVFAAAPAMTKKFISTVITKYKGMGFRDNQLISRNVPPIYAELRGEHNRKMVVDPLIFSLKVSQLVSMMRSKTLSVCKRLFWMRMDYQKQNHIIWCVNHHQWEQDSHSLKQTSEVCQLYIQVDEV